MNLAENSVVENNDLNLDVILSIIKNAGIAAEHGNERLLIENNGITSNLFFKSDVINVYTTYNFKEGVILSELKDKLIELNGNHSFTKTTINEKTNKLVVSMNYLTTTGVFIPHFILTLNGFFAFQRIGFQRVDFSDFLE